MAGKLGAGGTPGDTWAGSVTIAGFCNVIAQAYRMLRNNGWFVADLVGLERADQGTKALIEAVGQEFFERFLESARVKSGLVPTNEEVVGTMKEHSAVYLV